MKIELQISGMGCGHCVDAVRNHLQNLGGLEDLTVEIGHAKFSVTDAVHPSVEEIESAVSAAGYTVTQLERLD